MTPARAPKMLNNIDLLQQVIETVSQPIFVKDADSRFVALNASMCQLMGHDFATLIGRTDYDFVPTEQADIFRTMDRMVIDSGEPNENEELLSDPDGRVRNIITSKYRLLLPGGGRFIVGCITDITRLRQLESSARQSGKIDSLVDVRNRMFFEKVLGEARAVAIQLTLRCFGPAAHGVRSPAH